MNILFISFIDSSNIGDLLIAKVLEKELMQEQTIRKYSFNLVPEKEINSVNHERDLSSPYKLFIKNIYNDYFRKLDLIDRLHLHKIKKNIDSSKFLTKFEEDVKWCDLLVIGGGNAIFDLTKHSLSAYKFNKILNLAKKYNKKTFITSIGIGPFQTKKQIDYTLNTLKNADQITVRDKKSYDYIKSLGDKVHLSIDPVFLLNKLNVAKIKKTSEEKVISLCVIDLLLNKDNVKKYKKYIKDTVKLINKLIEEDFIVNLFSTEPRDYRAVRDVYNKINKNNKVNLVIINNSNELIELYDNTDLIIGTRMHSMIIGLSQLIPVVGISWQDKVKEMFKVVGISEDVFDLDDLGNKIPLILKLVKKKLRDDQLTDNLINMKHKNTEKFDINNQLINNLYKKIES